MIPAATFKDYGLRPLWVEIIKIYQEYARICKEHNLRHYAAYGTVLGAVRHHGFIPWDDDFDVIMPRQDYDKFVSVVERELPAHLKFISHLNCRSYSAWFSKIQLASAETVERVERETGNRHLPHGIYIDIFPVDGCYVGVRKGLRCLWSFLLFWRRYYKAGGLAGKLKVRSLCAKILGMSLGALFPRLSTDKDFELYDIERLKVPLFGSTPRCATSNKVYRQIYPTRDYPVQCLGSGVMMPFEDMEVPVPSDYDTYLRTFYGEYMVLPDEKDRHATHGELSDVVWRLGEVD